MRLKENTIASRMIPLNPQCSDAKFYLSLKYASNLKLGDNSDSDHRETPAHLILSYPAIFLPGNKTETITSKQKQKPMHGLCETSKNYR